MISRKGVNEFVQEALAQKGIITIRRVKYNDLWWLEKATGAKTCKDIQNISADEIGHAKKIYEKTIGGDKMIFVEGVNPKSVTLLLRANSKKYLDELNNNLKEAVEQCEELFGNLDGKLTIDKNNYLLNWPSLLQLFTAIGAQTLALRGSEKSMYGKLFEKLVLGSLLTILDFKLINPTTSTESKNVFWLSEQKDKRESDATLLVRPGVGVRFDIGFIGPGNSEISLDKVSRFEREMEFGRQTHYMNTLILIDRIGEGSRIKELAKKIHGSIVQMSMSYWIKEVCDILAKTTDFKHPILKLDGEESIKYIRNSMVDIDLSRFI